MKIALIDNRIPDSQADGASVYVAQLGPALAQEHRVSILNLAPGLPSLVPAVQRIRRMVIDDRPDIVHLNNVSGPTLAAVLWGLDGRAPVAMSLHDYRLIEGWRGLNRSLTRSVGLVISPSNYVLGRHLRFDFFSPSIKLVLPYGIDEVPAALAGQQSPPGEGLGGGYFIFRSTWPEPFPVAIQEAFRSGNVVIASRVGGIPEMIRDGVNGLLVEPGDEAGIAAAVERLQKSPELAARLRASALETARLYDMRFYIARLTDAYRELLTAQRVGELDRPAA